MTEFKQLPVEACDFDVEIKAEGAKPEGWFKGYASKFGGVDSYKDTIQPGAYTKTLKKKMPPHGFINHDSYEIPVLDWIKLEQDDIGLLVEGLVDLSHYKGPTLHSAIKRKAMNGMSIGYTLPRGGFEILEGGGRLLKEIDLIEISVVTRPADDKARIAQVKDVIGTLETLRDCENFLRDSGKMSSTVVMAFLSQMKSVILRDSEAEGIRLAKAAEQNEAQLKALLGDRVQSFKQLFKQGE